MKTKHLRLMQRVYIILFFCFMYLPIAYMIVFSFNQSKGYSLFTGFTIKWYSSLLHNSAILHALLVSLEVALISAVIATVLGTAASLGIASMGRKSRLVVTNITYIPVVNPEIITGISLMLLFVAYQRFAGGVSWLPDTIMGFPTLLIAHIAFNVPYVIFNVTPKLKQLDIKLYEAALDLGCDPRQAFFKVILPEISRADLWDEQYAGNILMFNNSRDAYAIAAFKSGHDINPQSTEEVDEVVEELKAQKPLVQAYVMDEIFDKMIGGEAAVGVYYSGDAITMIDDNPDLAWVFPEEGSVLSVDCMAIPAASEHQEAAEMFINFMCETDIGKANAEYIGYTTPMHDVWEVLDEDLKESEIAYPPEEAAAKEKVFTALSDDVNSELDVKWSEMKSYDEGGSSLLFLALLAAMVALACFNIWRKVRRRNRNQY